jgi:hypothetical protein
MAPFEGKAPGLAGTVLALAILGALVFPLRVYVRASNRSWGWDDGAMLFAVVGLAARLDLPSADQIVVPFRSVVDRVSVGSIPWHRVIPERPYAR